MTGRESTNAAPGERTQAYRGSSVLILFAAAFAAVVGLLVLLAAPAYPQDAGAEYRFTKVADSAEDRLDPFNFGCSTINARGDVAFRAGRVSPDAFNTTDGIYRANANGRPLTTIVQDRRRFDFIGFNPSMNDSGEVSFAARLEGGEERILRGDGGGRTAIASTEQRFNSFGFDTSVSNAGVVAFKAELDRRFDFDEGLFSGRGGAITTHYLASTSRFDGTDSRPSINDRGRIAFEERVAGNQGIFVTRRQGGFETIAENDGDGFLGDPRLNNAGTVAFARSFFDEASVTSVTGIATGSGGPLTTVVDNRGPFDSFGFRSESLNDDGDVAFIGILDDTPQTTRLFVGPYPVEDRVISTGDTLDGATVQSLTFCEEGLSDTGKLAFIATLVDPEAESLRTAVFRATPRP